MPRWLKQLTARFTRPTTLGERGERAAARLLRRSGYRILARNLRNRLGEIDIVAEDRRDRSIVIVEVKATASDDPPPEAHVNRDKQRKLTALAHQIVRQYHLEDRPVRFDVIGVVWCEGADKPARITHHENAFEAQF